MTKADLIKAVAEKAGVTQAIADKALGAVVDAVVDALASGDAVTVPGLGTFKVTERAARTARNPKTGETVQVAASKAVGFKAGKAVKDKLN